MTNIHLFDNFGVREKKYIFPPLDFNSLSLHFSLFDPVRLKNGFVSLFLSGSISDSVSGIIERITAEKICFLIYNLFFSCRSFWPNRRL